MYLRRIGLFCALSVLGASNTVSAPLSYTCDVAHVYDLSREGKIETSSWETQMKGSSFSVSRSTGEITGEVVPTLMAEKTWVVTLGSGENSFKAAAEFVVAQGNRQIQVIEVQEFRASSVKPFVALSMGGAGIVTGVCR
jgi:hypothetical protein